MKGASLRRMRGSVPRSLLVGALATVTDLLTLWLLIDGFGLQPTLANVPALTFGVALQFFGNKLFAFQDARSPWLKQGLQFAAVEVGALALNALAFHLLVTLTPLAFGPARLVGSSMVYVAFSYPLWARIFRSPTLSA